MDSSWVLTDDKVAEQGAAEPARGRRIPLTLFLQVFLSVSIGIVTVSICSLLLRFISETEDPINLKLTQQQSRRVASALERDVSQLNAVLALQPYLHGDTSRRWERFAGVKRVNSCGEDPYDASETVQESARQLCRQWEEGTAAGSFNGSEPLVIQDKGVKLVSLSYSGIEAVVVIAPALGLEGVADGLVGSGVLTVLINSKRLLVWESWVTWRNATEASAIAGGQAEAVEGCGATAVSVMSSSAFGEALDRGFRMMTLIAIGIAVMTTAAGALFVHMALRPMVHVAQDMRLAARGVHPDGAAIEPRRSLFTEIDGVATSFAAIAAQIELLRSTLPGGSGEEDAPASDDDMADLSGTSMRFDESTEAIDELSRMQSVLVAVTYESRSKAVEIGFGEFEFRYAESDGFLFERLCDECKAAVDEDEFQDVQLLHVNDSNEHTVLQDTLYLLEILASHPKRIRLIMQKSTTPLVGAALTGAADAFNGLATVAFVGRLLVTRQEPTATVAFICLYAFTLGMNLFLSSVLLRSGTERFRQWTRSSGTEVTLTLILSTFSPQNVQLVSSSIKIGEHCLNFNAPFDDAMMQKSLSWSLFGFLFSDVMQLLFKIWILYNSATAEFLFVAATVTSSVSVAFNVLFRLHAVLLWNSTAEDQTSGRSAGHEDSVLTERPCALIACHYRVPSYVRQLNLKAVELNSFYTTVFGVARKYQCVILLVHGGSVVLYLGLPKRHAQAALSNAMRCALELSEAAEQRGHQVCASLSCGTFPTGFLGTIQTKVLHTFADIHSASVMSRLGATVGVRVVCTMEVLAALGLPEEELRQRVTSAVRLHNGLDDPRVTGGEPSKSDIIVASVPQQLWLHSDDLRAELGLPLMVCVNREGHPIISDVGAAELAAITCTESGERGVVEQRLQALVTSYHAWRREEVNSNAVNGFSVTLSTETILGFTPAKQ